MPPLTLNEKFMCRSNRRRFPSIRSYNKVHASVFCLLLSTLLILQTLNFFHNQNIGNELIFLVTTTTTTTNIIQDRDSDDINDNHHYHHHSDDYPSFIKKSSGKGWKVWHDEDAPYIPPSQLQPKEEDKKEEQCHWERFLPHVNKERDPPPHAKSISICLHDSASDKWISESIRRQGRWADCDSLTHFWNYNVHTNKPIFGGGGTTNTRNGDTTLTSTNGGSGGALPLALEEEQGNLLFIDIGANFGSCVLQILLTTNATIVAFEPNPSNVFRLTSTLLRLEPHIRRRVYVFPVALGNTTSESEIYAATNNKGNTIVGKPIQDKGQANQTFLEPVRIPVERLDDLLDVSTQQQEKLQTQQLQQQQQQQYQAHLVKMDAQGYECNIVAGARNFLQLARAMHFELEPIMLNSFANCSDSLLWKALKGWEMYKEMMLLSGMAPVFARIFGDAPPKLVEGMNIMAFNPKQQWMGSSNWQRGTAERAVNNNKLRR